MRVLHASALTLLFLTFVRPGFGQSTEPASQEPAAQAPAAQPAESTPANDNQEQPDAPARVRHRALQVPCWKQAGLPPDLVNQRWKLEDQAKVRIAAACNEASTTAQQKHDKIEAINAERDRAIADLIPAKELAAFNACQAKWDKAHPKPAGEKALGPCGGTIPANSESSMPEMGHSEHH